MPDDLFGSIRDISTRIQTEIAEASQPAEAVPATSGGMSDIGNQLEVAQNMSLFMEAFAPQGNSFDPATQFRPGELPTEISFADLVQGTQVQTPTPSALPPPAGKPNAEALAAIEAELQNDPAIMDNITAAFGGITSYDDYVATLAELGNRGEIPALLGKLNTPEGHQYLGFQLGLLQSRNVQEKNPQISQILIEFTVAMDDGQGTYADTVRDMCKVQMPQGSFFEADTMMKILDQDPNPEQRINDLALMHELRVGNPPSPDSSYKGYMNASEINAKTADAMNQYINGELTVPAPMMWQTFSEFPKYGESQLNALNRTGQLTAFMDRLQQSGEKFEPVLKQYLPDTTNNPALQGSFEQIFQNLLAQRSPSSDDFVRELLGKPPSGELNSVPKPLLLEMIQILKTGDDKEANAPFISGLYDAYNYPVA